MQRAVCKMPRKMSQIPEVERVVGKRKKWNRQKNAALFDGYSSRRKAIKSAAKIK